jgi:pimeloyl-ACP methyl ester carboxylesterase
MTGAWEGLVTFDGEVALRACSAPVLVIEAATPNNRRSELLELLPSITVGQTVGAGHFNQLVVPDQVNSMIERFLAVNDLLR